MKWVYHPSKKRSFENYAEILVGKQEGILEATVNWK